MGKKYFDKKKVLLFLIVFILLLVIPVLLFYIPLCTYIKSDVSARRVAFTATGNLDYPLTNVIPFTGVTIRNFEICEFPDEDILRYTETETTTGGIITKKHAHIPATITFTTQDTSLGIIENLYCSKDSETVLEVMNVYDTDVHIKIRFVPEQPLILELPGSFSVQTQHTGLLKNDRLIAENISASYIHSLNTQRQFIIVHGVDNPIDVFLHIPVSYMDGIFTKGTILVSTISFEKKINGIPETSLSEDISVEYLHFPGKEPVTIGRNHFFRPEMLKDFGIKIKEIVKNKGLTLTMEGFCWSVKEEYIRFKRDLTLSLLDGLAENPILIIIIGLILLFLDVSCKIFGLLKNDEPTVIKKRFINKGGYI